MVAHADFPGKITAAAAAAAARQAHAFLDRFICIFLTTVKRKTNRVEHAADNPINGSVDNSIHIS
jgi:hypothetical protein